MKKVLRLIALLALALITTVSSYVIALGTPYVPMLLPLLVFGAGTAYALIISLLHQEVFE